MKTVNIHWEKVAYCKEEIQKLNNPTDYGLYQINGRHNAYGMDALLYIGKSQEQRFSTRLKNRWEFQESCAIPHTLRIGRIVRHKEEDLEWPIENWKRMIDLSEKLLLHTHAPAFNKQGNSNLYPVDVLENNIHIFNWGDFGSLLPEVSAYRYSFKYWIYEVPLCDGTEIGNP